MSGLLLALDSSGAVGSVALGRGDEIVATRRLTERREHASRLLPAVAGVLDDAGADRGDLTGVVVGAGPGSFTGVRVAAATAKGLAHALGLPLRAVSSLVGTALVATHAGAVRYVLFDARSERVYSACYEVDDRSLTTLVEPSAADVASLLAGGVPSDAVFVGDGAERYAARLDAAGWPIHREVAQATVAEGLLRRLAMKPDVEPISDRAAWEPTYVRAWRAGAA